MALRNKSDQESPKTFYDFNLERYPVLLLGSYTLIKSSTVLFIINVLFVACIALLYAYGLTVGFYTMVFISKDKSVMVQAFYGMGLIGVSIGIHIGRIVSDKSLAHLTKLIKKGIFVYDEEFQAEYIKIKERRIKQLQFLVSFISNGMFFCAFNNTVIVPLMQLILGGENEDDGSGLNPYLPFQIYLPFNTRNFLGYSVAYALNAIVMFTMYASFACHEELYICSSLQLTTEIEVLSYSLRNIEKRALMRLKRSEASLENGTALYDTSEYQACLYYCLRENILHHHAILGFRDAMRPYVEATTTVVVLFFSFLMAAAIVIMLENTRPQLTLITDIFGFLPMCWVGQLLINESEKTKASLFGTPWPDCSERFKVLLNVFMSNTQKPIVIKSRGFTINISLETFADMVSVGYKIMNVMR